MAQFSYFWGGSSGDAGLTAPYGDAEVSWVLGTLVGAPFIIPEYGNECKVVSAGAAPRGSVFVYSGAALVEGYLYTNDNTVTVTLDANAAGNPRIDAIVLQQQIGQIIRADKITGTAAVNPSFPTIGSDCPVAYIWVPAGFNPATSIIQAVHIWDARPFKHIGPTAHYYTKKDWMPNGEFMAYSGRTVGAVPPEFWRADAVTPPSSITSSVAITGHNSARGAQIRIQTAGAGGDIYATFLPPTFYRDTIYKDLMCTWKFQVRIDAGTSVRFSLYRRNINTGAVVALEQIDVFRTGEMVAGNFVEFVIRDFINVYTVSEQTAIELKIEGGSNADFYLAQMLFVDGYVPGGWRPKQEILFYDYDVTDAAWALTAYSTGLQTINFAALFNAPTVLRNTHGVIGKTKCRDSGSAGGGPYYAEPWGGTNPDYTVSNGEVNVGNITNDTQRDMQTITPIAENDANVPHRMNNVASGAGTLDVDYRPVGIIT